MQGWLDGRLVSRREWAPGLATLRVEAAIEPFAPGQFVNLGLDVAGEIERRSYSIASPPGAPLEFLVAEVARGHFTPALFALRPGDAVLVERRPQGFFTLAWVPEARDLWLVATGTGLGPFLSILKSGEAWARFERVILVHGARDRAHLAHREEIEALARERSAKLATVFAVSREPGSDDTLHGRVTSLLADGALERAAGHPIDAERSHLMLCGNPAMIEEMIEKLSARDLRRHRVRKPGHISIEKYW